MHQPAHPPNYERTSPPPPPPMSCHSRNGYSHPTSTNSSVLHEHHLRSQHRFFLPPIPTNCWPTFEYHSPVLELVTYSTKQSTLYLQHHINDGSGPYYLASKSIFNLDHTYTALTTDDVSLNLLLGHLVILLPDKPRRMLCQLIKNILSCTSAPPLLFPPLPAGVLTKPQFHISSLPMQYPELRRQFIEGSHAMFACLPTPKIYVLGPHAYCLPSDCLQHHLSYGYKAAFFNSDTPPPLYSHIRHSPRGVEVSIGNKGTFTVGAMLWSDDCDPQNSKKNRIPLAHV